MDTQWKRSLSKFLAKQYIISVYSKADLPVYYYAYFHICLLLGLKPLGCPASGFRLCGVLELRIAKFSIVTLLVSPRSMFQH